MFEPGIKKNCIVLEKVLFANRLSPPRVTKLNSTYCDVKKSFTADKVLPPGARSDEPATT